MSSYLSVKQLLLLESRYQVAEVQFKRVIITEFIL